MVGNLTEEDADKFSKVLSKYFDRDDVLFVASSDFCHWGKRFDFTHYDKSCQHIYQGIESLDRQGMDIIEGNDYR